MKNIWHIFTGDVRRIKKNVIALIALSLIHIYIQLKVAKLHLKRTFVY